MANGGAPRQTGSGTDTTVEDPPRQYTAPYVPDEINNVFGRLVESPLGYPFRPWAPESKLLRGVIFMGGMGVVSSLPSPVDDYIGAVFFLVISLSPLIGPWGWAFSFLWLLVPVFLIEMFFDIEMLGVGYLFVVGNLFLLSVAYYLFVRGSSLDPYRQAGTADGEESLEGEWKNETREAEQADTADGEKPLEGEWKHETREAEQAHRKAQQHEPPVEVGERVAFPIIEVDRRERQVQGSVERFRVFVDHDVPEGLQKGDMICAQIVSYATDETGKPVGAHARLVKQGPCP